MKFRIDILDEQDRIVFMLTGRIQAEQVSEQQAIPESDFPDHKLVLDLEEVKLVDRHADDASVPSYQQTVLTAFQQLEDNLAALRPLEQEAGVQATAVQSAERSLDLSNTRYEVGVTSYLEVITAQNAALSDEVTAVNILAWTADGERRVGRRSPRWRMGPIDFTSTF